MVPLSAAWTFSWTCFNQVGIWFARTIQINGPVHPQFCWNEGGSIVWKYLKLAWNVTTKHCRILSCAKCAPGGWNSSSSKSRSIVKEVAAVPGRGHQFQFQIQGPVPVPVLDPVSTFHCNSFRWWTSYFWWVGGGDPINPNSLQVPDPIPVVNSRDEINMYFPQAVWTH